MTTEILKNTARFILLVLVQVLVIQHVNLTQYIILLPYVMFILMLPFEATRLVVMFSAFLLGLSIDFFYDSSGLHAGACALMGFARPYVLKYITPREGYDSSAEPTVSSMGFDWFTRYAATLILIHHFYLLYLEVFRFSEFFQTLLRVILSSAGTFGFIYLIQFIFLNPVKRS